MNEPDPFDLALRQVEFAESCCRLFGIDSTLPDPQREDMIRIAIYCRALGLDHTEHEAAYHVNVAVVSRALGLSFDAEAPEMPWDHLTCLAVGVDPNHPDARSQTLQALARVNAFGVDLSALDAGAKLRRIIRLKAFGIDLDSQDAGSQFTVRVESLAFGVDPDAADAMDQVRRHIASKAFGVSLNEPDFWRRVVHTVTELAK